MAGVLERLAATIVARKGADPTSSHTAAMLAKGPEKCAEKFGEEAVEAIIEAVKGDPLRLTAEAADVLYHLLVMLAARDLSLSDVLHELERREGMSGIAEKASRAAPSPSSPAPPAPPSDLLIRQVFGQEEMAACFALREAVFMDEQGVSEADERDGKDLFCRHYLATLGDEAVGTARILPRGSRAKIQRVAVARDARGAGIGRALIRRILDDLAADTEVEEAYLDSRTDSIRFYEGFGFVAEGEDFLDAGIPHRTMRLRLQG
jgi:phosphoribosyl-ATP pyrophosphohydrolase